MSITVNEYRVAAGEHIATVNVTAGEEVTKVIFDDKYYYFYIYWTSGSFSKFYVRVKDIPEIKADSEIPADGTLLLEAGKGYVNTFHEFYSNSLYLYQPFRGVYYSEGMVVTIVATNNKNVNY